MDYEAYACMLKAMADPSRIKIIDLLSRGTMCACEVAKHFEFSQPTLSYHMKILEKVGIVDVKKNKQWHHYSLNAAFTDTFTEAMTSLFVCREDCICHLNEVRC